MPKHLVLVGGGHAHMVTLANIARLVEMGHKVSVIGPSEYHYYSGMGPGMLGNTYTPADIRFATRKLVEKQGGRFIPGRAVGVDPEAKTIYLESGANVHYDVASFNTGSHVLLPDIGWQGKDIFPVKPIERLMKAQKRLLALMEKKKITVGIAGGGPSAAEIAGNVWGLARTPRLNQPAIRIFSRGPFMSRFPDGVRKRVIRSLISRKIKIHENSFVQRVEPGRIITGSQKAHEVDFIFLALGVRPSSVFKDSGLPLGPDGGLLVNRFLQSTGNEDIFGGGDCIYFKDRPLDKVGVYAVRENPVLYHNMVARLEGREMVPFDPGGGYLLIFNLGGGRGVLHKGRLGFGGSLAFRIKNYIDLKFMRKYQDCE